MPLSDPGFRSLAETVLDAILTVDENSVIVYANPAVERIFGYPPDELVGRSLTVLMPPEMRAAHLAAVSRYLSSGERTMPWSAIELPALHRDGRRLLVELSLTHLTTPRGTFLTGIARDVTSRAEETRRGEASHAVARVLARLPNSRAAIDEVLEAICRSLRWQVGEFWAPSETGEDLTLRAHWHDAALPLETWEEHSRAHDMPRGDGLPGRVWVSHAPEWIEEIDEDDNFPRSALAQGLGLRSGFAFPVGAETEFLGTMAFFATRRVAVDNDLLRTMETVGAQLGQYLLRRRAEERVGTLLASERRARELSEMARHRAEFLAEGSRLLASSMSFHSTLASITGLAVPEFADYAVLYLLEDDGPRRVAFAHADPAKEPLVRRLGDFGVSPAFFHRVFASEPRLIERVTDDVLDRHAASAEHRDVLRQLAPRSGLFAPMRAHGELMGGIAFAYSDSGRRYRPDDLELALDLATRCALAVANARLYQQAQEATLARDRLLAVVSHDLRNLLHMISLRAAMVGLEAGSESHRHARVIGETVTEMSELIEDLLEMARAEELGTPLRRKAVAPEDLLRRAAAKVDQRAEGTHRIVVTVEEDLPPVEVEPGRAARIFDNLIANALRHTPEGTRIDLGASPGDGCVVFSVRDDGPGIAEDEQGAIFERYRRGSTSGEGGAGLGLSIARSFVEAHGGRIWVESAPGRGACFRFTLPSKGAE